MTFIIGITDFYALNNEKKLSLLLQKKKKTCVRAISSHTRRPCNCDGSALKFFVEYYNIKQIIITSYARVYGVIRLRRRFSRVVRPRKIPHAIFTVARKNRKFFTRKHVTRDSNPTRVAPMSAVWTAASVIACSDAVDKI